MQDCQAIPFCLGVIPRTVVNLSRQGVLRRVVFPNRRRAFGYARASVEALVAERQSGTRQVQA